MQWFLHLRKCFSMQLHNNTLIEFTWKAQNSCCFPTMVLLLEIALSGNYNNSWVFQCKKLYLDIINLSVDFYTLQCFISSSGVGFFSFRKWQRSGSWKYCISKKYIQSVYVRLIHRLKGLVTILVNIFFSLFIIHNAWKMES